MTHLGLRDLPIESDTMESLGLGRYATALSAFARQCQTPLTIALQGDWGSGKTSLMNLIRADLEKEPERFALVWFNTWQYSQFGLENELALSLISYFMEQLKAPPEELQTVDRLRSAFRALGGSMVSAGLTMGGLAGAATKFLGESALVATTGIAGEAGEKSDPSRDIAQLKKQVQQAVSRVIGGPEGEKRIVVFIDDLDRLSPVKAVELLESFKLFLDIPGCVFFLACDYQVVSQGLKMKFGVSTHELKGKSFFDKIIQLPFQMPVTQYKVAQYIEQLLKNIDVAFEPEDIPQYKELIESSIGFNPRNLKRAFNCLLLLNLVAENQAFFADDANRAQKREKQKIIFASVCMQRAFESVYNWLAKKAGDIDDALFQTLMDEKSYESDNDMRSLLATAKEESPSLDAHRLARFMRAFYRAAQLRADGNDSALSQEEVCNLQSILTFSAVTATSENVQEEKLDWDLRRENRWLLTNILESLNKKEKKLLRRLRCTAYSIYQPRGTANIAIYASNNGRGIPFTEANFWLERREGENYGSSG